MTRKSLPICVGFSPIGGTTFVPINLRKQYCNSSSLSFSKSSFGIGYGLLTTPWYLWMSQAHWLLPPPLSVSMLVGATWNACPIFRIVLGVTDIAGVDCVLWLSAHIRAEDTISESSMMGAADGMDVCDVMWYLFQASAWGQWLWAKVWEYDYR